MSFPSDDEARALHTRVLARDPTANADLCDACLERLRRSLQPAFRAVDEHLIDEAVERALLDYLENPNRYDPSRSPLRRYLSMLARRDLLSLLKREGRAMRQ